MAIIECEADVRELFSVDRLAGRLRDEGLEVHISEEGREIAGDVRIVFDPEAARGEKERTFVINADRSIEELEALGALGGVDGQRYFRWKTKPESESGRGVMMRKDLAATLGVQTSWDSKRYAMCSGSTYADLPALIAAYLKVATKV